MDSKSIDELLASPTNPRKISTQDFDNLKQSLREFGDLFGVMKNLQTGHLVGGHMRTNAFRQLSTDRIVITQRFDAISAVVLVGLGYIMLPNGEQFAYCEVVWDEAKEKAANIAANRIREDWDKDLLAQVNYELSQLENGDDLLKLTGQGEDEIAALLNDTGAVEPEPAEPDDGMQCLLMSAEGSQV